MTDSEQTRLSNALEAWVDAQRRRDFSAYAGHYAEEFLGTKRVGERATHFNRARWLLDRQSMFKPGLNVEVRDARLERVEDRFFATFTQDFSTPQFRDTGKKLLVFVKTSGGLQIIREEMLSSEVQGGGGSVPQFPGFFAALPHGVVLRSAIDERWLTPKRRALAEAMRRQAEEAEYFSDLYLEDDFLKLSEVSIPPEVMAMRGKTLQVVQAPSEGASAHAPPCEARIAEIEIHNSATESFESTRGARGLDHLYGTFVLGRFERPCPNALWATEQEPPIQHLPYKPDAALAAQVTRAVLRHPAHKKLQAAFAASGGKGLWDAAPGGTRSHQAFDAPAGERLVVFSAYRGGGSDDFTGSLDVLCFVDASGVVRVRGILGHDDDGVAPRVAVDLDGDGRLEILSGPTGADGAIEVLSFTESTAVRTPVYFAPNFVCPG